MENPAQKRHGMLSDKGGNPDIVLGNGRAGLFQLAAYISVEESGPCGQRENYDSGKEIFQQPFQFLSPNDRLL